MTGHGVNRACVTRQAEVVRPGRLRWSGHVERKSGDDWVSAGRIVDVVGKRLIAESGRLVKNVQKMTWISSVCARNEQYSCIDGEVSHQGKRLTLAERGRNELFYNK